MNKTAIKNFAIWARRKLISDITYKAGMLGVTENGIAQPLPQSMDRGGRFLPDHFRPCSDGLFCGFLEMLHF